jgi:hypothetical protein
MKRFTKAMMLAVAGAVLVSQSSRAAYTPNDLILGFAQSSATSDLVIDLGQASSLIGQTAVVNLSSDLAGLTSFNSTFNNSPNGVDMAVVGGSQAVGHFGVFATQLRSGGAGNPAVAGSSITATHSSSQMSGGAAAVGGIVGLPTAGNLALLNPTTTPSDNKGWTTAIDTTGLPSNFIAKTGVNPNSTIGANGIIYEDLFAATTASAYTYEGYFTFNYGADSLTFTPATLQVSAVPEPATYGVIAAAGLLVVSLRRQIRSKTV